MDATPEALLRAALACQVSAENGSTRCLAANGIRVSAGRPEQVRARASHISDELIRESWVALAELIRVNRGCFINLEDQTILAYCGTSSFRVTAPRMPAQIPQLDGWQDPAAWSTDWFQDEIESSASELEQLLSPLLRIFESAVGWIHNLAYIQNTDLLWALADHGLEFAGSVHPGFAAILFHQDLGQIKRRAEEAAGRGNDLVIAGHSQGGALATLTAAYLHSEGIPVNAVYTFGCPRTGDTDFRQSYNANISHLRIEHIGDLVPLILPAPGILDGLASILLHLLFPGLPPTFIDYAHVGDVLIGCDEEFFPEGEEFFDGFQPDDVIVRLGAFVGQFLHLMGRVRVLDAFKKIGTYHSIEEYIREIRKELG